MLHNFGLGALALGIFGARGALGTAAFANSSGMCAGSDSDTTIFLGNQGAAACNAGSLPEEYIAMKCETLAFLKAGAEAYLTDSSKITEVLPSAPGSNGMNGEVVGPSVTVVETPNFKFGKAASGRMMGHISRNSAYGFIGIASYLMLEGALDFTTNDFKVPGNWGRGKDVTDVCVVPLEDGVCGSTPHTATPGTFKFSMYGYMDGNGYSSFASGYTHVAVRQRVTLSSMGSNVTVAFNGGAATAPEDISLGNTSITSLSISGASSIVTIAYPATYNVGTIAKSNFFSQAKPKPAATLSVIIHAVPIDSESFFLDFIFALDHGLQDKNGYFVYDPDVTVSDVTSAAATTSARSALWAGAAALLATLLM
mmetsp:Transcript_48439/g.122236  ORF Transcript_48439/g.122236 Transcript_48439/m.122236 type:complete len:368 (-) Transcript_48439:405-1508(-)